MYHVRYREQEQQLLGSYVTGDCTTMAPNVIVLGYRSFGKTHTVLKHLQLIGTRHTIINCDEFITHKLLLQSCLHGIRSDSGIDLSTYNQKFMYKGLEAARISLLCETFAHFLMALEQFVEDTGYDQLHVLVLDRFDQCIDSTEELFRSFLKFREYSSIRNISVIYVVSHGDPMTIATMSVPHVYFSPYTPEQATQILIETPVAEVLDETVSIPMWAKFVKLMVDLFFGYTGSDILQLKDKCHRVWPLFLREIRLNNYQSGDFLKIYRNLKDEILRDDLLTSSTVFSNDPGATLLEKQVSFFSDLTYHSKFILIAAYLASHGDQRMDPQLFSKVKAFKKKPKSTGDSISKHDIDSRLLSANYFDLERLKAILSVIYRNEAATLKRDNKEYFDLYHESSERELAKKETEFNTFTLNKNVDLNCQISTLVSLDLLNLTYARDTLSNRTRWKCNVGWDIIEGMCREIQFPIQNYAVDK